MTSLFCIFLALAPRSGAAPHLVSPAVFSAIAGEYSGERAQESIREIVQHHRIQASPMMAEVAAEVVLKKLKALGVEARLESFKSDGKTVYGTFISPVGWQMRGGELWVEGVSGDEKFKPIRLCRYADVPMCVSTYSRGGELKGELVEVGAGIAPDDYKGKNVAGKIVLASGYAEKVVREAVVARGAAGAVIYPAADDRPDHPEMIRYNGVWPRANELAKTAGSFQISATQYALLKRLMAQGAVRVRGSIDAEYVPGQLTVVHAYFRGSDPREVLVSAHLDHPKWSANDNASGAAAVLEMARTLKALLGSKKVAPLARTIHLMWVPEFYGTAAYLTAHPEVRGCRAWDDPRKAAKGACVLANLNLDMVGEDTVKTDSHFYFTRAPDSVPSFMNALLSDVLVQTQEAELYARAGTRHEWAVQVEPYLQGSDHDQFLGLGVPATMIGHAPDWTHHTSEDTIDKTDASELLRAGVFATAAAHFLATADRRDLVRLQRLALADALGEAAERLAYARSGAPVAATQEPAAQRRAARAEVRVTTLAQGLAQLSGEPRDLLPTDLALAPMIRDNGKGPRRLVLLPIHEAALEGMSPADQKWSGEQEAWLLAHRVSLMTVVFETINFMNGARSASAIAEALSDEFGVDFTPEWVTRLVAILASQKLVTQN